MWGAIISAAKSAMDKRNEGGTDLTQQDPEAGTSLMSPEVVEALKKYKMQQAARDNSQKIQAYSSQQAPAQMPQAGGAQMGIPRISGGQIQRMPQGAYGNDPYADLYSNGLMGTR